MATRSDDKLPFQSEETAGELRAFVRPRINQRPLIKRTAIRDGLTGKTSAMPPYELTEHSGSSVFEIGRRSLSRKGHPSSRTFPIA